MNEFLWLFVLYGILMRWDRLQKPQIYKPQKYANEWQSTYNVAVHVGITKISLWHAATNQIF